jgi:sulfane dehydrogenase subunit SoxC
VDSETQVPGRLIKAPENFLDLAGVREVVAQAKAGRRFYLREAFAAAGAAPLPVACAVSNPVPANADGPKILDLPASSRRHAGRGDAVACLTGKIQSGGSGIWGATQIPAQMLAEAEA